MAEIRSTEAKIKSTEAQIRTAQDQLASLNEQLEEQKERYAVAVKYRQVMQGAEDCIRAAVQDRRGELEKKLLLRFRNVPTQNWSQVDLSDLSAPISWGGKTMMSTDQLTTVANQLTAAGISIMGNNTPNRNNDALIELADEIIKRISVRDGYPEMRVGKKASSIGLPAVWIQAV